jgi:AcrR family transcriptional regulator
VARKIAKDHDDKRRLILQRAAELFASEGYHRATVAGVAAACDISKANIYHYYASKDAILFDVLDSYLSTLRDRICGMDLTGLSPEDQLRRTVTEVLLAYQGADHEHQLQGSSIGHLPEAQQAILLGYQRDLVAHASRLIGAIAPETLGTDRKKLRAATMSVFGMLNWFYMWSKSADAQARADYGDLVCNLCLRGLPGL